MRIALSGSSGFIGSALREHFEALGHKVIPILRKRTTQTNDEIFWNIEANEIERDKLENFDVLIHLAGEGIANKLWSKRQKQKISKSRILGTRLLVDTVCKLKNPPKLVVAASAIGFYGNRKDELLDEHSKKGEGFLAELGEKWEKETTPLKNLGIRTINARFGLVLDPRGGVLKKMLLPFKLGIGGKLGRGEQYLSWIALEDVLLAFTFFLDNNDIVSAVNLVSPSPVTNAEFTKTLAKTLRRPAFCNTPAWALRLILGELADELLLSSQRVMPNKLLASEFKFTYDSLDSYLKQRLA